MIIVAYNKSGEFQPPVIEEIFDCVSEGNRGYGLYFAKMKFGVNPTKLNLRNLNIESERTGTGIGLTDEQWESATNALLRMGFGDTKTLEEELKKRKARVADEGEFFNEP